ncbi:hypothetical protein [Streptomyces viridosporus]|uniref:hypothetical protein n=1 Tax=Streptomyces viridosporus TaxID=67581 RepID=UPI0033239B86
MTRATSRPRAATAYPRDGGGRWGARRGRRTLLDRYGPGAHHWTNATAAASDPAPDFLASGLQGTSTHRFHTSAYIAGLDTFEVLGVIAVNDEEVGVFWSFGAY